MPDYTDTLKALAGQFGFEFNGHIADNIDPEVLALVPRNVARRYWTIPLSQEVAGSRLRVKAAISDPLDADTVDALRRITNLDIEPVIVPKSEIRRAFKRFYAG